VQAAPSSDAPGAFSVRDELRDGVRILRVAGELDLGNAARVGEVLGARADAPAAVVIELREVTFMDSTGVRELLEARRLTEESGGRLALLAPSRPVQRVLELSKLIEVFEVIADLDDLAAGAPGTR
jgi:stage II sporulation protein AA (anti-sigma F factor antagonist)